MKPKASGAEALGTEYLYLVHPENLDNVDMFYALFVLKKTKENKFTGKPDQFWYVLMILTQRERKDISRRLVLSKNKYHLTHKNCDFLHNGIKWFRK